MEYIHAKIVLSNPRKPELKPIEVDTLVDTGAETWCIPDHIALQLELMEIEKREVTTADGRNILVPYVGPIQINFERRTCLTGAIILGDSVLMGAVPMEDMDLVLNPAKQTITPNPASPNILHRLVK
jgi:clan AA aspartic protease